MQPPVFNVQDAYFIEDISGLLDSHTLPRSPYTLCYFIFEHYFEEGTSIPIIQKITEDDKALTLTCWGGGHPTGYTPLFELGFDRKSTRIRLGEETRVPGLVHRCEQTALAALYLLNCKNVTRISYDPNKGTPWRKKLRGKKKPKPPYVKYEILEIQPLKNKTKQTITAQPRTKSLVAGQTRIHRVRGHFKTFDAHAPLFGKLTGIFWWGDCIRGNPDFGAVEKSYRIKIEPEKLFRL